MVRRVVLFGVLVLAGVAALLLHARADRPSPAEPASIIVVRGSPAVGAPPARGAGLPLPDPQIVTSKAVERPPMFKRWVDEGERVDPLLAPLLAVAPIDVVMQHKLLGMQLRESRTPVDETRLRALIDRAMPGDAARSGLRILCTATMCELAGSAAIAPLQIADAITRADRGPSPFDVGPSASGTVAGDTPGFVLYLPRRP